MNALQCPLLAISGHTEHAEIESASTPKQTSKSYTMSVRL